MLICAKLCIPVRKTFHKKSEELMSLFKFLKNMVKSQIVYVIIPFHFITPVPIIASLKLNIFYKNVHINNIYLVLELTTVE